MDMRQEKATSGTTHTVPVLAVSLHCDGCVTVGVWSRVQSSPLSSGSCELVTSVVGQFVARIHETHFWVVFYCPERVVLTVTAIPAHTLGSVGTNP